MKAYEHGPPHTWPWLVNDVAIPKFDDGQLLSDCGVDPDHLSALKEYLGRQRVPVCLGVATTNTDLLPSEEGQATGVTPSTTQRQGGSPTSHARSVTPNMTSGDPRALAQVNHRSHGKIVLIPRVDPEWREKLERLIQRKFNYGLGYKSIIHIFGLCLLYISKLKHRIKNNKDKKTEHCSRLFTNKAGIVPWCMDMLCGLSHKHGCGRPHPRSAFTAEFLQANRPDFEKHNLHFRLQPVSVDSKYLGDPEGLKEAVVAWKRVK